MHTRGIFTYCTHELNHHSTCMLQFSNVLAVLVSTVPPESFEYNALIKPLSLSLPRRRRRRRRRPDVSQMYVIRYRICRSSRMVRSCDASRREKGDGGDDILSGKTTTTTTILSHIINMEHYISMDGADSVDRTEQRRRISVE
jgi:hypothetical protein